MTSWGGTRQFALQKKTQEPVSFFQTTQDDVCSNFNLLFLAYTTAVKNTLQLYVHDVPNPVGESFPLLQSILKDNSTIKYLKEIPPNSRALDPMKLAKEFPNTINFQTLKRMARDLFFYNGDAQEKIMSRIRGAGLERTLFDVGVHIQGDRDYVTALQTFAKRLGKPNLSIFVMADSANEVETLKRRSPPNWSFTTFQTTPPSTRQELFYQYLTELHILQNIPNLVLSYSSSVGRFLYLTSRFSHTADSIVSLDVRQWSIV